MQWKEWRAGLALLGILAVGCSEPRSTASSQKLAPSASVTSVASSLPASSASVPQPTLDEPAVRTLVDAWLATQNASDFAGYEKLYAERFTGVKRSGSYQARFDRKGWLRDRAGMFVRPMRVSAAALEIAHTPSLARVTFEQTWSSGSYKDVGRKQLVVVPTREGPRIAREEMLSSKIAGAEARAGFEDLMTVGRQGVFVHPISEPSWATGPVRPGPNENIALRSVNEAALPAAVRALKGRSVNLLDAAGALCEARIVGFELYAEVIPHFGMVMSWHGQNGEPALSEAKIAEQIWALAPGAILIGKLSRPCPGLWALDAARTPPTTAAPEPASPELRATALRAFRALPQYAEIQKEFRSTAETPKGRWEDYGSHLLEVSAFHFASKLTLVIVQAQAGNGCGDFANRLVALFGIRKGTLAELELIDTPDVPEGVFPSSAFDLDADGSLELLFGSARDASTLLLWRKTASGPSISTLFNVPFLDCGC